MHCFRVWGVSRNGTSGRTTNRVRNWENRKTICQPKKIETEKEQAGSSREIEIKRVRFEKLKCIAWIGAIRHHPAFTYATVYWLYCYYYYCWPSESRAKPQKGNNIFAAASSSLYLIVDPWWWWSRAFCIYILVDFLLATETNPHTHGLIYIEGAFFFLSFAKIHHIMQ